jgi:NAD(P)-dependent dehydrogenase (short-subunit alcohol dehydrogenase family)
VLSTVFVATQPVITLEPGEKLLFIARALSYCVAMTKKTILITGCSSGIGLASARMLKARGWHVFATARKPADLARLRSEDGLEAVYLELADTASIGACVATVLEKTGGRLDAVFNNAAYGQVGAVEDLSSDLLRRQLEVNLIGTHEVTRLVIPAMRQQKSGRIVQCSSVLGFITGPYRGAYSASKYALEGLTDALRAELQGTGIHVSLIEPGPIRTKFLETALATLKMGINRDASPHRDTYALRIASMEKGGKSTFKLEPEAVAEKLVHAVESPRPKIRYFVTKSTYVAAIAKRTLPDRVVDLIVKRL